MVHTVIAKFIAKFAQGDRVHGRGQAIGNAGMRHYSLHIDTHLGRIVDQRPHIPTIDHAVVHHVESPEH